MELKEFLKIIASQKKYIFASVIICLMLGYFFIINERQYTIASFSVYMKLVKVGGAAQSDFDELKNTFFILKTAESFIDSVRYWLKNDLGLTSVKISSRKITPQHLLIQIRQRGLAPPLSEIRNKILEEIIKRKDLLFDKNLNLFSVESSDYKEYQNAPSFLKVIILSILGGGFIGIFLILFLRYIRTF